MKLNVNAGIKRIKLNVKAKAPKLVIEQQVGTGRPFIGTVITADNYLDLIENAAKVMNEHAKTRGKQLSLLSPVESK